MEKKVFDISTGTIWRFVLIVLLLVFIFAIREVLLLLFISVILLSAMTPIVEKLEAKKIPRFLSAFSIYVVFFIFIGFFVYLVFPIIAFEMKELSVNAPAYLKGADEFLKNISALTVDYNFDASLQGIIENYSNRLSEFFPAVFSNVLHFFVGLLKGLIVLSLTFYMLVKKNGTKNFIRSITPKKNQVYVLDLAERIQRKMGRWMIGQFTLMLIIFCLNYLVLWSFGVPYALLLALIGGLLEIIPYIGPIIAIIPAVLFALTVSPWVAFFVFVLYVIIEQVEGYVFTPLVMGKAVGLNPVIVILSLLIGGTLAGVLGIIISVPFATALSVFLNDLMDEKQKVSG